MRATFFAPLAGPVLALALGFAPQAARAQYGPEAPAGPAIGGYDAVAYFTLSKPTRGDPAIAYEWDGARWLFATEAHRRAFRADPRRYAPQYRGWCAYAAARGYAAEVDPVNAWTVRDGRLYLNYSSGVSRAWKARADKYVRDADARWPKLRAQIDGGEASISRRR